MPKINYYIALASVFLYLSTNTQPMIGHDDRGSRFIQTLFTQSRMSEAEMRTILQATGIAQSPERIGTLIRIHFQSCLDQANTVLEKNKCAQRYTAVLTNALKLPSANSVALVTALFTDLPAGVFPLLAVPDNGVQLKNLTERILKTLNHVVSSGTPETQHTAAHTWIKIIEKYAQALTSSDALNNALVAPCLMLMQETALQTTILSNITTLERNDLAKNSAIILSFLLANNGCLLAIMNLIQQLSADGITFTSSDQTVLILLLEQKIDALEANPLHCIDHVFCFLPTARSLQRPDFGKTDFRIERYIERLKQTFKKAITPIITTKNDNSALLEIMDKLDHFSNSTTQGSAAEKRLSSSQITRLIALANEEKDQILAYLLTPENRETFNQTDASHCAQYVLKNKLQAMTQHNSGRGIECATLLIDIKQLNEAQKLLAALLTVRADSGIMALADQSTMNNYNAAILHLYKNMLLYNPAMLKASIQDLLAPFIKLLIKMKRAGTAFSLLITISNTLRRNAVSNKEGSALITEARLDLLQLINSRLLDFASPQQADDLTTELKDLSEKAGADNSVITNIKEELKQRSNEPYLNYGIVRWALGGLSKKTRKKITP